MNFADLFDNAPCGYVAAHNDRGIASLNATLARWLGQPPEALIGRPFTDLLTVGGRIHFETHFWPLLQMRGEISGVSVDLRTADGERVPVYLTANTSTDADGRVVQYRLVLQDARDRRSYERELLDARRHAEQERTRAQLLVKTLQRSLLPPSLAPPDGMDACAFYHAATTDDLGGDFYDVFPLSRHEWGFFLGDVCGKGADAAALTSLTRYTLRAAAVNNDDPQAVLRTLDLVLKQDAHDEWLSFCTVIFGVLTRRQGGYDVHLAGGGHPPPVLLTSGGRARYVTVGGRAAGLPIEAGFRSTRVHLGAGDTLVLYSDGLTEARTGVARQRYNDDDALLAFASAHAPTTASAVVDALKALLDSLGAGVEDDVAILALGVPVDDFSRR